MNKKIGNVLILGAGFIGKNLVRFFLNLNYQVKVLDNNPCPEEFSGRLIWEEGSFSNKILLQSLLTGEVDVVYHLISSTVPGSDTDQKIIQELYDNVFTTIEFLNICKSVNVKKIVFASSSSVYGLQDKFPIGESAPTNPISAHGIQKLALEKYFQLYSYLENFDICIVRISNPYGPGQKINGRQGFIAIAIGGLINNKELLVRDGGRAVRDFIYIDDLVEALYKIGLNAHVPMIINIGSGVPTSLNEVISTIEQNTGKKLKVINGEKRDVDIPKSVLDIALAIEELNFTPKINLSAGIEKTMKYHGLLGS